MLERRITLSVCNMTGPQGRLAIHPAVQQPVSQYLVARFVCMNDRNLVGGLFLIAISLAFGLASVRYPMGKLSRAGHRPRLAAGYLGPSGPAQARTRQENPCLTT